MQLQVVSTSDVLETMKNLFLCFCVEVILSTSATNPDLFSCQAGHAYQPHPHQVHVNIDCTCSCSLSIALVPQCARGMCSREL